MAELNALASKVETVFLLENNDGRTESCWMYQTFLLQACNAASI